MDQQILFNSEDQSEKTFKNFFAAENSNVLSALGTFLSNRDEFGCFYIYGVSGCGKTHLLKSAVNEFKQQSAYLDIATQVHTLRELSNNRSIGLLAVDNMENICAYEADMMLIFETLRQRDAKIIVASKYAPKALPLSLRDLSSRFSSGQVFELKMLADKDKVKALELRASLRGFVLSNDVISYVINRYPRDFNTLFELLDKLDNASLQNQRKITVPFIKKLEANESAE